MRLALTPHSDQEGKKSNKQRRLDPADALRKVTNRHCGGTVHWCSVVCIVL